MSYKVKKQCRVCGKLYTPCADCENDKGVFHWRTVSCSTKCAMEYFAKVEESRKLNTIPEESKPTRTRKKKKKNDVESEPKTQKGV